MIDRTRNRMFVTPAPGIKIRKTHEMRIALRNGRAPDFLSVDGEWVPRTIEWARAVKCGDVKLTDPGKKTKKKTKKSAKSED